MSAKQEEEALKLIDEHGDKAAQVAWSKASELSTDTTKDGRIQFEYWFEVAHQLELMKGNDFSVY